jgi:predicted XRE-type DNA-binding protein
MIAVITGDIINSRELPEEWLGTLRDALNGLFGKNINWEIFRGDSFQVELNAKDALINAIYIKACIKVLKGADVRIGIGIGKKSMNAEKVTEANGEAFINSGSAFDTLKTNKVNIAINTPWPKFNEEFNLFIKLALIPMDSWGQIAAEMVKYAIENQNTKQDKIAKISGRSQSSVSEALKRARFTEIMELENRYRTQITKLIKK